MSGTSAPPQPIGRRTRLRGRGGLVVAAVTCVVAGGIALFAAGRGWVGFTVVEAPLPQLHKTASGHAVAGVVTPLALVVLAAVVALPATRTIGRRLAGVLVALAGLGLVVEAVSVAASPASAVAGEVARLVGRTGVRPTSAAATGWPWVAVVGGVLAVVAGVVTVAFGRDWPAMGRRYESGRKPAAGGVTEASMWDRLDEGDDPTL